MDRLEQLKNKYAPALKVIEQQGVSLKNLHVEGEKLVIRGAAPSDAAKNEVWTAIKRVDATYADLMADLTIDPSLPQPAAQANLTPQQQLYAVRPGDTLAKISKQFYGDANKYQKIFDANRDQLNDPDKIKVGQVLKIPAA
jgi:nucleoid-associated protein YgaU